MKNLVKNTVRPIFRRLGYDVVRFREEQAYPSDFSPEMRRIWDSVRPFTMTSAERVSALVDAVRYVVVNGIPGAFVECGVWKGGSSMAMALALQALEDRSRHLYLYDTFQGMSAPTDADVSINGEDAPATFDQTRTSADSSDWCRSSLEEVKANMAGAGYPAGQVHYVQGKVEDTIPATLPASIAILRLDTDWYESTRHELLHLFPLLSSKGVLIIDDYGHWKGARKAVDEYFAETKVPLLLNRIDYTGRIGVKP